MLFFFKQKTAYEMRISDWSSDVCSSDLVSVSLAGSWSVIDIVRADGFSASDIRPLVRLNVSVILEENGRRESGVFGMGGRYLYDDLFKPESWSRAIDEAIRSEEHTSELQSLMRISYAVFCLKKKKDK